MIRIYQQLLEELRRGTGVVLATVVRTSGSTPQKPGSKALFSENGLLAGTVGGGFLEEEVRHIAASVLITGISDHYFFNLDADQDEPGSICGGSVVVLVDADPARHLKAMEAMEQALRDRRDGWMLTSVEGGRENGKRIKRSWIPGGSPDMLPPDLGPAVSEHLAAHQGKSPPDFFLELEPPPSATGSSLMVFLERITPLQKLVIAGAGHIGRALAHLGRLLDFETTVIDDRPEYATRQNIPDADHLVVQDIGRAMHDLDYGPETYVVIVTRGHRHDTEALRSCIGTDAAYVGMIGSVNKVQVVRDSSLREGWATPEQWSRIHAPVGLPIGSKSIQEIAISIAAELVQIRRQKKKQAELV